MKKIILSLAALIATVSATVGSAHELDAGTYYYITSTAGCSRMTDNRAPAKYYFGLYINRHKGRYDSSGDERVYLWVDSCPGSRATKSLEGKWIYLSLKDSEYSPGHWDRDIKNAETFEDLVDLVKDERNSIVFEDITSSNRGSNKPIVKVTITDNWKTSKQNNGFDSNDRVRMTLEKRSSKIKYYNSKGEVAIEQNLTSSEFEFFEIALSQTQQNCSFDLIIDSKLRKIIKVKSSCVDLSTLELFDNFG